MYDLLEQCWNLDPTSRPDFKNIGDVIGRQMEASVINYYIELNNPYTEMNAMLENDNGYVLPSHKLSDYVMVNMMTKSNEERHSAAYADTTVL